MKQIILRIQAKMSEQIPAHSLAFFRVIFGLTLVGGSIRFIAMGFVDRLYVQPKFFFTFYGFDWIQPLPEWAIYAAFAAMALAGLFVVVGFQYRIAITTFFLLFTYVELIDKTNYLNHYYFVSLITFLMIWLPLNSSYSVDALRKPWIVLITVPRWMVAALLAQIGFVYFFGGVAKLSYDWLINAQPLSIWLPANSGLPIIGPLLNEKWVAYALSWGAMIFDLTIAFVLCNRRMRPYGYAVLLTFHFLTAQFFRIGMFPYLMSTATLLFFSAEFHKKALGLLIRPIGRMGLIGPIGPISQSKESAGFQRPILQWGLAIFFGVQLLLPFRHHFYPGNPLWTEEAYRFSWNIMLMEKNGMAEFTVVDKKTGKQWLEIPRYHLTPLQEKQMSMQPDMILQFAHHLEALAKQRGHEDVAVYADTYVKLNGKPSRALIDPKVDLTEQEDGLSPKSWILPFDEAPQFFSSSVTAGLE